MVSKLWQGVKSLQGPTTHTAVQPCTRCTAAGAVAADQVVNAHKYVHHVWTAIVLVLVTALFVVASLLPLLDPWATAAGLLTGEPVEDSRGWWAVWECVLLRPCGAKEEAVQACHDRKFSGQSLGYRRNPNDAPGQPCCRCCTPHPSPNPGFLMGTALLLVPRSARRRTGAGRATALQCLCVGLVIGAAAAGAVGVGLNAQVGTEAAFLKDGSCVDFGFWDCLPVGSRCGQGLSEGAEGQLGTALPSLCMLKQCATCSPVGLECSVYSCNAGCCP